MNEKDYQKKAEKFADDLIDSMPFMTPELLGAGYKKILKALAIRSYMEGAVEMGKYLEKQLGL